MSSPCARCRASLSELDLYDGRRCGNCVAFAFEDGLRVLGQGGPATRRQWPAPLFLLALIAGGLLFVAVLHGGQQALCHVHGDALVYCSGYSTGQPAQVQP